MKTAMKLLYVSILTAALAACGSKPKPSTTPENKGGTATEVKSDGSATGGETYGGATTPPAPDTNGGAAADPCAGE
jgi:predicted small lipoprotein YifL